MSFVPLVRIWVWASALTAFAGWLLSALGQLNRVGYAAFAGVVFVCLWAGRKYLGWGPTGRIFNWRKIRTRFRRWLPAGFLGLAFLVFLGSTIYPPTTHEGLSCRVPRVLHWLAEGHWYWIHTPNIRMDNRPCSLEWLSAPLLLFTRSDRGLFLVNFIPWLFMPGLIFSVLTRLGVRPRVAWPWMWLLPTGYNFMLQGGSLGNDTTPAVYALAAVDFGLRAWGSRRPGDLWVSILSAAFLTGTKVSNLPLLLPWAILGIPLLPLLKRRLAATLLLILLAASVSFLPTAALNAHYCGDWSGLKLEHAVTELKKPLVGIWGNSLLMLKNFAPPFFPFARAWNQSILTTLPHAVADPMVANFEPGFHALGELPIEDGAGIGFGISWLLTISLVAGWVGGIFGARSGKNQGSRGRSPSPQIAAGPSPGSSASRHLPPWLRRLLLLAPWVSLLAYCSKAALMDFQRHISGYYALLLPSLLIGARQAVIVRRRWWRVLAAGVLLLAVPVVVLTPGRPLWPAQTVLSKLVALKPDQPLLKRALTVYSVYNVRSDPLAEVRALLPPGVKVVGFMGTPDDIDISLWRPIGTRRVKHILVGDSAEQIRQRQIEYAVVGEASLQEKNTSLADWQQRTGAELIGKVVATTSVSQGPRQWYLVRFAR